MFQAFEILIKGIRSGSIWHVGKRKGVKLKNGQRPEVPCIFCKWS